MNLKKIFILFCVLTINISGYPDSTLEPPYDHRDERVKYVTSLIHEGAVGVEIGVWLGSFAYHVLLQKHPSELYLIDPWEYGLQKDMEINPTPAKQRQRDALYEQVCQYFAPYENVEIIRQKSEDAVSLFPDDYFDYVYIDGEHSYDAVMRDLTNYLPKVKVGGYLIGDDYGWTGIAPAVQDFLKKHPGELQFLEDPYEGKTGGQFAILKLK
jgi:hypothetical protein